MSKTDVTLAQISEVRWQKFPVWMELEIGGLTREELIRQIKGSGQYVNSYARSMVMNEKFITMPERQRLKLARATVHELGFAKNPTIKELWARLASYGAQKCHPSVGPHLRLALPEQARGDWFWCYMDQISDSDGYPHVWLIKRDSDGGAQWLRGGCARPGRRGTLGLSIVFVLGE